MVEHELKTKRKHKAAENFNENIIKTFLLFKRITKAV
jgi:hypothetical protein